jgi:hypothetical protein
MKRAFLFFSVFPAFLVGCAHEPVIGEYQRALQKQGFVGYYQPVGDPRRYPTDSMEDNAVTVTMNRKPSYITLAMIRDRLQQFFAA